MVSAAANFGERIGQTRRAIAERDDIDALIISDLNNVRWLTGLASSNAAALVTEAQVLLVTDSRYAQRAIAVDPLIDVVVYRAALATVVTAAIEAITHMGRPSRKRAVGAGTPCQWGDKALS